MAGRYRTYLDISRYLCCCRLRAMACLGASYLPEVSFKDISGRCRGHSAIGLVVGEARASNFRFRAKSRTRSRTSPGLRGWERRALGLPQLGERYETFPRTTAHAGAEIPGAGDHEKSSRSPPQWAWAGYRRARRVGQTRLPSCARVFGLRVDI